MARPEITGKKVTGTSSVMATDLDALSIEVFCMRHSISIPQYYKMRKLGQTPVEFRVGTRVLISKESAAQWRREREDLDAAVEKRRSSPSIAPLKAS
jgi:hypothetical protein